MHDKHRAGYINNLLAGILLISSGLFIIFFAVFKGISREDWFLWALAACILVNTGIFFAGSGFVHKVKSDLIRRQRQREHFQKREELS